MNSFTKLMCYAVLVMLIFGFFVLAAGNTCAAEPVPEVALTEAQSPSQVRVFTIHGKELRLYGEEAEMIVEAVSFAAGGSMRLTRNEPSGEAAPYAARVGIIATIFNRMADSRFPDRASRVIAADPTLRALTSLTGQTRRNGGMSGHWRPAALDFVKSWKYYNKMKYNSTNYKKSATVEKDENFNIQLTNAALEAALTGFDPTCGALYFRLPGEEEVPFTVTCEIGGVRFGTV